MEALQSNAARLSSVEIVRPEVTIGRSINESIQAGLYYSQLGMIRELSERAKKEVFGNQSPIIIGTGGFAYLFEAERVFTAIMPDLVLQGLRLALAMNRDKG